MANSNSFPRVILFLALLTSLLAGISAPVFVSAAPMAQLATNVVISEFRTTGPAGGTDEFVEIYNPTNTLINISLWKIQKSTGCGGTSGTQLLSFPASTSIASGQYLLITGTGYTGVTAPDFSTTLGIADDGGIAITDAGNVPIDQVGMCSTTFYKEGTTLVPLSGTANQSYERGNTGCTDSGNNAADFIWNQTTSNPQNSSSIPVSCLRVTNVTSTTADGTYTAGAPIAVDITFSTNVNVTGSPTLLLETGATHRNATYSSGSGSNTLTFNYTVIAGDVSGDLDYVATNSLSLNGGTITGAVGNANLTLPSPGAAGSLGANKNIVIDNLLPPTVTVNQAVGQADPTGLFPINFTVVFSETIDLLTFTNADITQSGAATGIIWSIADSGDQTTFTLSATAVTGAGTLIPSIAAGSVTDSLGNPNIASTSTDNTIVYENTPPTVTVNQAVGQADPASATPVNFTVVFSEPIDVSTFIAGDITQSGTVAASLITWGITDSGDQMNFTLSATAVAANGTLIPSIAANKVTDVAGNNNLASSSTDNTVIFNDNVPPTVTVNQAVGQADPTGLFPINFTVVFSEPIIASIFTPSDITQTGTATGITWSIADSGNHTTFTLSATAVTGIGTLIPSIAANRVTDLVGNNNIASASTDNTVTYENISPSVTVNQAVGQADPTSVLPIYFTVVFSEPIIASTFTSADITQTGTATGITWVITDSGDHMSFTLSATTLTAKGTLKPYIVANRVTDIAGNNNFASTSTDNTVTCTAVIPTATRTLTPTPTATPTLNLLINEIAWMGTKANTADEWIELYNPGASSKDLTGWKLSVTNSASNSNFTINLAGTIPAGGYFVLASNTSVFNDLTPQMTFSGSLSNDGEVLKLLNPSNITVDTANSDGGGWPAGTGSPNYASMERVGKVNDGPSTWATFASTLVVAHDRSNNAIKGTPGQANWVLTVTLTPTPTRTPTGAPIPPAPVSTIVPLVARLIINEFLPRPGFDWNQDGKVDVYDEFIEIKNIGTANISLSGWKLDDEANLGSNPFSLPALSLKVGERMILYGSQTNILLSDGGDTVRLLNSSNIVYDAYTYTIAKVEDQSVCRLPDGNGSWYEDCVPTPNLTNTREGVAPSMPGGGVFESPVCELPDTLPADFLFAECRGFGANIWDTFYWDEFGWQGVQYIPEIISRWESFVE